MNKILNQKIDTPCFIYDGSCPFCRYFAEMSELKGGIEGLQIKNGRSELPLLRELASRGYSLNKGAILIIGQDLFYGDAAIHWVCSKMQPSPALLKLLSITFSSSSRAKVIYPLLLLIRRLTLFFQGISFAPLSKI